MFNLNLKDLAGFNKKEKGLFDLPVIKDNLCGGLFNVMESAFDQRKADSINSKFSPEDVDQIIKSYSNKNMILATASSIVPGPFGILGSIPELLLNFGNQMNMIYDLGCAYGKENFINKDVLLELPFAAFGGNTNLSALQNASTDLLDSPNQLLIDKANQLGASVIERSLKKSVIQFIPIAGPILMGTWAKMTTAKISNASKLFFDTNSIYVEHFKKEETREIAIELQIQKIKGLANLIESNNEINEKQIAFIGPIIENAEISDDQKKYLLEESLKIGSNFQLDFQLLKDYEEDESLVLEMVILAKRSGFIDRYEKEYIHRVGSDLNLEKQFIESLLEDHR